MGNIGRYLNVRAFNIVCQVVDMELPVNQFIFRAINFHVLSINFVVVLSQFKMLRVEISRN